MRVAKGRKRSKSSRTAATGPVDALIGLGPVSRAVLSRVGISTIRDLERAGPVGAFVAAKAVEPTVSLNLLWGIAGALSGTHWSKLERDYKATLLLEYDAYCDIHGKPRAPSNNSLERSRER